MMRQQHVRTTLTVIVLVVLVLLTFYPFVFMIITSLKSLKQYYANFWLPAWPVHPRTSGGRLDYQAGARSAKPAGASRSSSKVTIS